MDDFHRSDIWLAVHAKDRLDREDVKARPVLIISNNGYNSFNNEVICVHLTTDLDHKYSFVLDKVNDFEKNHMIDDSAIRFDVISRYSKNSLVKKLAILKKKKTQDVIEKTIKLICE